MNKLKNIFKRKTKIETVIKDHEEIQKEIIVTVGWEELIKCTNTESYYIDKLRESGVPISLFGHINSGTLLQSEDFITRSYVFKWRPGEFNDPTYFDG